MYVKFQQLFKDGLSFHEILSNDRWFKSYITSSSCDNSTIDIIKAELFQYLLEGTEFYI